MGCTVIELLTGKPPYYNRAPMAALFSIVQDDHPPLPDGISQKIKDFLLLCFEKDPSVRSTAAVLLSHPWLQQPAQLHTTPRTSKSPPMTRSFSTSLVSSPEFTHRENFREKQLGESRCASAESSPTLAERSNRNGDRAYFSDNISPRFALDTSSKDERSPKEDTLSNVSEASLNSEQKENTVERALLLREAALIKISVSVEEDVEDVVVANLPLPVVEELSVRFPEGLSDPNILSSAQRNAFSRMRMQSFQIPEDHGSSRSDWSSSCETSDFNLPDLRPWSMPDNRTGDLLNDSVSRVPPMLHEREVSLITSSYSSVKRVHGVPPAFNPSMYTNTDTPVKTVTSDNNTPGSGPGKLVKSDSLSRVPPMLHDREVSSITISYSAMKPYQSVQSFPSNTYNNINTTSNFNTLNSTDTTINTNNNINPFINLNPSNSSYLSSNTATDSMVRDEREREAVVTNATWGTTATHDALSDELSDAYADNLDDNLFTGTPLSLDDEVDERRGLNILRKALKSASFLDLDTEVSPVGSEDISETEGRGSLPLPPPPLVLSLKKPTEAYGDRGNRNGDTSSTDIRVRILGGSHHRNNSIDGLPIDDVHSVRISNNHSSLSLIFVKHCPYSEIFITNLCKFKFSFLSMIVI